MSERTRDAIESWLKKFMSGARNNSRDDVHLDELGLAYSDPRRWLEGAIECLLAAAAITTQRGWPVTTAIELFIEPGPMNEDVHTVNLDEMAHRWSHTPPALTVYRLGAEPWEAGGAFTPLSPQNYGIRLAKLSVRAFFQEWFDAAENAYDKRIWLVNKRAQGKDGA